MLARSEIRQRWRGMVLLTLLVAVVGSVVLSAIAGARRSDTALTRFQDWSLEATANLSVGVADPSQLRALGRVPEVSAIAAARGLFISLPRAPDLPPVSAVDTKFGTTVDRARIIAGRAASPSAVDELTIGEKLSANLHLRPGDHLDGVSYTPAQAKAAFAGAGYDAPPAGPRLRFRIVGIVRRPHDLGRLGAAGGDLVLTPAFYRAYSARIGSWGSLVRVRSRDGAADLPRLKAAAVRIFGRSPQFGVQNAAVESGGVQNAVDVLVAALWIFAGVAALAGVVAIGIVVAREISLSSLEPVTAGALGITRAQRIAMSALPALLIACGGALLAAIGSVAASPLFPIGVAGRAEPNPGVHVDRAVLALGFVAVIAAVSGIAVVAAVRGHRQSSLEGAASPRRRTARVPELAARAGLAPPVTNGLRTALQPGYGRMAVPVRSAFLGAICGVLGVTAVLGYASSLSRLVTTPRLYGWTWDVAAADNASRSNSCSRNAFGLLKEPGISAVAGVCYGGDNIELDGHATSGWGFASLRGRIDPEIVAGRAPSGPREVGLGRATMRALGKHIGDTVRASGPNGKHDYRVVGQVVLPILGETQPLAEGAAFTADGFAPFYDPHNFQQDFNRSVVVRFTRGISAAGAKRRIAAIPQLGPPTGPKRPVEVERLDQVSWFPATLAAFLGSLTLVAVGHGLVTAVGRRRRELAMFKTLGWTRRQVRATVAWQATTQAAVGLLVGIPIGIVVGDDVWRVVATGIGVSPKPRIPMLGLFLTIVGVLALVNLIAALPASAAARTRPAVALRSE